MDVFWYIARFQLKMSDSEFWRSSPRQILGINRLHENYYKNILLDVIDRVFPDKKDSDDYNEEVVYLNDLSMFF